MYRIPLMRPYMTRECKQAVLDVLDSGMLTEGPRVAELEAAFGAETGTRHAVAVTSCTTGLELVLRCLGVGPGDEVIVPDYTYPATAFAPMLLGATAVVVDVSPDTMLIDYEALEAAVTPRTRAVIPVSIFGNPLDWDRLLSVKRRHPALALVEDAACSLGAAFRERPAGGWGDAGVFSLHPRKSITTGEGGMVTTDNEELARCMRSVKRFGLDRLDKEREAQAFIRLGTNYKMSDIQAALGVVQLRDFPVLAERRRTQISLYMKLLEDLPVELPRVTPKGRHAWQSFCIFVRERDRILHETRARGIEVQIGTYALHEQPVFQKHPLCRLAGPYHGGAASSARCLALPLFHALTAGQQAEVAQALRVAL